MNRIQVLRYIYLSAILLINSAYFVICHRNSSNDISSYYEIHSLAEEEICHPLRRKPKPLILNANAIMIRPNNIFDSWTYRTTDLYCKFKIKTERSRIMAVIQNLSFRQVGDDCLDYIKFRRKYNETRKFCGQFVGSDFYSNKHLGKILTVDVTSEEIETVIFVSKEPLKPNDQPLGITITYTPYRDCTTGFYERLDDTRLHHKFPTYCIADTYNCDGYQNCITDYCNDEHNCFNNVKNNATGAQVTIAAVTTVLFCFVIFLISLWICRRHKKLCWSSDCAGPVPENSSYDNTHQEFGVISEQPVPSAPMLCIGGVPSTLDKDLPPSYESLFPENPNLTIT